MHDDRPVWEIYGPNKRSEPRTALNDDRLADERQRGESGAAYRCFLQWLRSGNLRSAADALGLHRRTLERYSRRWMWERRKAEVLNRVADNREYVFSFEEAMGLAAARDTDEILERSVAAFDFHNPNFYAEVTEQADALLSALQADSATVVESVEPRLAVAPEPEVDDADYFMERGLPFGG